MAPRTVALMAAAVLFAAGGSACNKKKSEEGKQTPTAAPSERAPIRPPVRPPPVRRVLAPITVDEAKGFLPTIDGARTLKAPQKAPVGERVEATFCFDAGEPAQITEVVKGKLAAAGWPNVMVRTHPTIKDRIGLSAGRDGGYTLTGTVQRGQWAECVGDKGQTFLSLGVHRLEERAVGPMPGMRGPGALRPNRIEPRLVVPPEVRGSEQSPPPAQPAPEAAGP